MPFTLLVALALFAGTWTPGVPLPERIQEHHAAVLRGRIYIAGGIDSTNQTTKVVYRFDPARGAWERLADLPEPRHHMPLVVLNDTLYAIGGFDELRFIPKTSVWIYRTDRNAWEERAPLPAPRGGSAAGVVNGKIILVGGYGLQRALLDSTVVYDPRTNTWRNAAPMPTKRDHLEAQVVNGILYAIAGRPISPANNFDVVEAYDLATDRWTTKAPMPSKRGGLASAVLDGKIHTFGGEFPGNPGVNDTHEVYDPARNAWTVETPMPTARHGFAAVTVGGAIYVIGGGPKAGLAQTAIVEVWRDAAPQRPQGVSLLGDTLRDFPLSAATRERYEQQLAEARAAYEHTPTNADSIIWYGRRLAYLGRIREAIDVYTRGLQRYPRNAWIYRHRGHRYLSVREIDRAIADLERATELVANKSDEVEPDGQPNPRNRPIGTLKSNIAYHLGLGYYLKGDFRRAIPVYRRELAAAKNDDRRASTAHWLYMSLRRLHRDAEASKLLESLNPRQMDIVENETYRRLLSLYKGELPVDSVLSIGPSGEMSVTDATAAYGVGNWHLYNGRRADAEAIFRRIIAGGQWGAFGYIAAEAELARARRQPRGASSVRTQTGGA